MTEDCGSDYTITWNLISSDAYKITVLITLEKKNFNKDLVLHMHEDCCQTFCGENFENLVLYIFPIMFKKELASNNPTNYLTGDYHTVDCQ